ncbi:transposase [Glaciimonas immobilis]|uniref:Transposase-like protein n=1 Tax=Glaciimonas immobilis TaxID=728004 RepID=A0A840RQZ0_9BURK|nr:transposase [Glaciimonas immobilis]KAF3997938.1 transposase [Glaciimonas immobilis]MBB5199398.1 transposase-like protein [Glaciimonas immobilis]
MGKYSEQLKLAVIEDYCSDQSGLTDTAQRHGVDVSSLRKCVAAYRVYQRKEASLL